MKYSIFIIILIGSIKSQCQLNNSHFYISDEYTDLTMHNYVESKYELDNKIAEYLANPSNSFLQKIGIVDLINSKQNSYKKSSSLFEHYCISKNITLSNDNIYILNLLKAKYSLYEANRELIQEPHNTLSKFLIKKYLELNILDNTEDPRDEAYCEIYKSVISHYDRTTFQNDLTGDIKELFFDVFSDFDEYCTPEELILLDVVERLGYSGRNLLNNQVKENRFKLKYENGVYKIPLKINDAFEIDFIYDSGASDVLISLDVFSTLVRMNKIEKSDLRDIKYYTIADGSTIESQTFNIKSLKIGEIEVRNVLASVSGIDADLLLGQSFQKRFKKMIIDNINRELVIIE